MFYKWVIFFCFLSGSILGQVANKTTLYKENNLWGLKENKRVTPAVYDTLIRLKYGSSFIAKKHKSSSNINSTGVISDKGKIIIPFDYLQIIEANNNFIVKKWENGAVKVGVISQNNAVILNIRFKSVQALNIFWAVETFTDELNLYYIDGSLYKTILADSLLYSPNPQFVFTYKQGNVGLIDNQGKQIYPPIYKSISYKNEGWKTTSFSEWQIISAKDTTTIFADSVQVWDSEINIIGINGNYQLSSENDRVGKTYEAISKVSRSFAITEKSKLFGAIHNNGNEVLRPQYNRVYYNKGYFYTYKNNSWSVYDSLGKQRSIFKYDSIGVVNNGLFPILRKGKWGFMNRNGKEVIRCIYDSKAKFNKGKAIIKYYDAMGIINLQGRWVVKPHYKEITDYSYNFYIYKIDNLYYLKNYQGDLIYFSPYTLVFRGETIYEIRSNSENEISSLGTKINANESTSNGTNDWEIIKVGGKYGFTDSKGILKITYRYDSLLPYTDDLAAFKLRGKWGFINSEEKIVIQPNFGTVSAFKNNTSVVSQSKGVGLINSKGKYILKPKYESISSLKTNLWLVTMDNLIGLFDSGGNVIVQNKYEKIEYINDDLIILSRNKMYGAVNSNGESVLPRVYSFIDFDRANKLLILKKE